MLQAGAMHLTADAVASTATVPEARVEEVALGAKTDLEEVPLAVGARPKPLMLNLFPPNR